MGIRRQPKRALALTFQVSNGIFLCERLVTVRLSTCRGLACSGRHRGLGVHISFVRSLTMDVWKPEQLRAMELGGNELFQHMLQEGTVKITQSLNALIKRRMAY